MGIVRAAWGWGKNNIMQSFLCCFFYPSLCVMFSKWLVLRDSLKYKTSTWISWKDCPHTLAKDVNLNFSLKLFTYITENKVQKNYLIWQALGLLTNHVTFREILDKLLSIVTLPVREALSKEASTYPGILVVNTCSLLATIISELSATATGLEVSQISKS